MKRVMVMLMAVFLCSLSVWCQSSMIVALGTEVIENNSFDSAEESFRQRRMPLQTMPSGKYGYMSERPLLMAVIDATSNGKIKEVDFLCGAAMWWEISIHLEEAGYTLSKENTATLGNGAVVPQKIYTKGTILCLVQTLDNDTKQVIFKRKPAPKKKKTTKKR